jgi:putative ABC transport system ATP-binding protein
MLRSLALLDPLDEGVIRWKGRHVSGNEIPAFRREVIYMHQRPSLFDGSVEVNLRRPFALRINHGRGFDTERMLALLKSTRREASFLEKSSRDLSGGEAQIVALLRAIQLDPSVLLLDEPTASLDLETTSAIEDLVLRWMSDAPTGRALIWVSHDSAQTRRVASRCVHMKFGKPEPCEA